MRIWRNAAILGLTTIVVLGASVGFAAGSGMTAIRVEAEDAGAFDLLGIAPATDVDYGSFRWLRVNDLQLQTLIREGVKFTVLPDAGTVRVMGFSFDPVEAGEPVLPADQRADPARPGFRLIQFTAPVTDEWTDELDRLGIRLLQYYPHNTYLVWSEPAVIAAVGDLPFVRWQGLFHPAYKINSDLDGLTGVVQNIDVMFYTDGDINRTLESLEKYGAVILRQHPSQPDRRFFNAIVELDADAVAGISRISTVLWAGYASPVPVLDDEMSDQIMADNHPGGVPVVGYNAYLATLGYDGSGVIWAPVDTGVDYDHPDLFPSIVGGYSFPNACVGYPAGSDCAGGGHGTHVSGIIGGTALGDGGGPYTDPSGFLYGLGVAPGYSIYAMNSLSGPAWPPAGGWQEHSKRAVLGNAVGGNNSWTTGEGTNHGYQASERTHDLMVRDGNFDTAAVAEPFIEVFSAGNSGPSASTLTAPKEGKNLIITAASVNYRAGSIENIASFSSRGPAVDGRWVPTIAAPGEQIASTRNDEGGSCGTAIGGTNSLYSYCSGTSMAAPHTSGAIVLATEWWRTFNAGANPSPAMAKALLVNSADDMGTADIPNINEGWGRINVDTLINPSVIRLYRDQDHTFGATGEQVVISFGVPDPGQPLKVSLAWTDAPGAVGANPALVNNLDLTVETDGSTYLGNVFSGGWSATGGSADAINNLENVFVQSPGGSATITIDATAIVGDGVPYNADITDQDFALVCSNCSLYPDFTISVTPRSQAICAPADAVYTVDIGSILSYNDPVTLSASGNPAGTTVGFSTNPVIPVGASTMTIGNTGAAAPGSYSVEVTGVAPTSTHVFNVDLAVSTSIPAATVLSAPANGAANQSARPTFTWAAASQAGTYRIQVATDAAFTNLVINEADITDTEFTPAADLMTNTAYWWRVRALNACGGGSWSPTWSFTTLAVPGDCGIGTTPDIHWYDDLESGAVGWTSGGTGNTWALGAGVTGPHSGANVFHANDVSAITDQQLMTPPIALPSGPDHTAINLQFWNYQEIEDATSGCYDGGILEITTDGGATWTYLPTGLMMTDPYNGPVSGSFSNPLAGFDAWCGDPQAWLRSVVDLDAYAGETVQFRFRLGTDSSVSRPGWDIDDVWVQSCVPDAGGAIFADDFESGTTGAWAITTP